MSFVQNDNVFVLKRVSSGVEVGINGIVVDALCAGSPLLVHTFMNRLFGFTYVCLIRSIFYALKTINDVNLFMAGKFVLRMNQFLP